MFLNITYVKKHVKQSYQMQKYTSKKYIYKKK